MRRANNQDAYATLPADSPERFSRRGHLFVVADGMGAHAAGELASQMAAEKISQYYLKQSPVEAMRALRSAVQDANADIHRRGQENPEFFNMGTTASSIAITPDGVIVAHVGDSRVYRVRDGKLEQLTFDHSLVWEMQASGQVHPDSSLRHAIPKNVITRSLGPSEEVVVDMEGPFPVKLGDRFLLCSDGLTGQIEDEEIGPLLDCLTPETAARALVDLANLRGGPDNTTAIIIEVTQTPSTDLRSRPTKKKDPVPWLIAFTPVFCFLAAILLYFVQNIGSSIVAVILGTIAAIVAVIQFRRLGDPADDVQTPRAHRSAPYRTCSAKPSESLVLKLGQTVDALKQASTERRWSVDWTHVDQLLQQADAAKSNNDFKTATAKRAEAIIHTMSQLRTQHRRVTDSSAG